MQRRGWRAHRGLLAIALIVPAIAATPGPTAGIARAQPAPVIPGDDPVPTSPYDGMPIRRVTISGATGDNETLVRNNIRTAPGQPFAQATAEQDVRNLNRLGRFRLVDMNATPLADGGVAVEIRVAEWPLVTDIQVTGNTVLPDARILEAIRIRPGDPLDATQISLARETIEELYRERGYYLASVDIDETLVAESGLVVLNVREGPRVKIRGIEFRGNDSYEAERIRSVIETKTALFLFRTGELDEERIQRDLLAISDFYRDRGHLDVRVDRSIELSRDLREARVVFIVDEGPRYRLRSIRLEGARRFDAEQIRYLIPIKPGDVYAQNRVRNSREKILEAYGRMGYVDAEVAIDELRFPDEQRVDLVVRIVEGPVAYVGEVLVIGNDLTKTEVVKREIDLRPNRPLDTTELEEARRDIRATRLFDNPTIRVQDPDPEDPRYRDVIVEVREQDTGAIGLGAAVSSDLGIFGQLTYEQRNFDIADFPESVDEFVRGRAFRGAGQRLNIAIQPGDEFSNFNISLTEPYLFRTENSLTGLFGYTERELESYDERRWGGQLALGRRLGDIWNVSLAARYQSIDLRDIDADAPRAVFAVEDENIVTGLGLTLQRNTTDNRIRPTRGSVSETSAEQIGALGGDFDFTRLEASHRVFIPLEEDFLGRRSFLTVEGQIGYQFGDTTPIYERFFLGGRSLRGFDYRTVSPKGIRNDTGRPTTDPIGGDWSLFLGTQYQFPLIADAIAGVVFVDSGTVLADPGLEDYRVSAGFGFRLYIDFVSPAPFAFDFGFPLVREDLDEERIFTFFIDIPFG